jgi:sugar transferase (PEP-CTERM system associated)
MPTNTIKNTIFRSNKPEAIEEGIKAWPCWIFRSKVIAFAPGLTMLAVILFDAAGKVRLGSHAGRSLGLILLLLSCQASLCINGFIDLVAHSDLRICLSQTLRVITAGVAAASCLFLVFPELSPGFLESFAFLASFSLLIFALRPAVRALLRRKKGAEGLLIIGPEHWAGKLYRELVHGRRNCGGDFPFGGLVKIMHQPSDSGMFIHCRDLPELTRKDGIRRIVVAEPDARRRDSLAAALLDAKLRGIHVEEAAQFYERLKGKIWLEALTVESLLYSDGFHRSWRVLFLKRFLDVVCSLALLAVAAPLALLIALGIKLDSSGPVLFRQVRVGLYGKPFVLYKFRSMRADAELDTGPVWAGERDHRVTRFGRLLRKFRLDEIPQVFNVLRGEMSLVGPRPERPHFVNLLVEHINHYQLRHYVKPGISGWAQVAYPYGASIEDAYEKLQYDIYYVKHMSLKFDVIILLRTIRVVLFGWGR